MKFGFKLVPIFEVLVPIINVLVPILNQIGTKIKEL